MTGMDGKKDPGKFTVRFNLCDPQQRQAAELLNRQGRSKAQFIANAVLYYAGGQAPIQPGIPIVDSEQLRSFVEDILTQGQIHPYEKTTAAQDASMDGGVLNGSERSLIFKTLDAFQKQ